MLTKVWQTFSYLTLLSLWLIACESAAETQTPRVDEITPPANTETFTLPSTVTIGPTLGSTITFSPTPCVLNNEWTDTYTVQDGDTLGGVAIAAGVSIKALQDGNCLENRDLLRVGDVLRVPNAVAINIATSPEGLSGVVVFIHQAEDNTQDIWTVKSDGTALKQITDEGAAVGRIARSPNHEQIAYRLVSPFVSLGEDDTPTPNLPANIWLMNADGTGQRLLVDQGPSEALVRSVPVWSPDGSRIAFTEQQDERGALVVINTDRTGRFVVSTGQFVSPEQVEPVAPAWSPDGAQLAYVTWEGVRSFLRFVDLETLAVDTLDSGFLHTDGPYWVPRDGEFGPPAVGYGVREAGETRWKIADPETGLVSVRSTGLVMASPNLAWYFRTGREGLLLTDANGIVQDQSLPKAFENVSWSPEAEQYVVLNEDRVLVLVDLDSNLQTRITNNEGAKYPLWIEPLWFILP